MEAGCSDDKADRWQMSGVRWLSERMRERHLYFPWLQVDYGTDTATAHELVRKVYDKHGHLFTGSFSSMVSTVRRPVWDGLSCCWRIGCRRRYY